MVVAYVRLYPSLAPSATAARRMEPSKRLHALVLPSALDEADWAEVQKKRSAFAGGCRLFPRQQSNLDWADVGELPVLLPYLGKETVTKDRHSHLSLLEVLKGMYALRSRALEPSSFTVRL